MSKWSPIILTILFFLSLGIFSAIVYKKIAWSNQKEVVLVNVVSTKPSTKSLKRPSVNPPKIIEQSIENQTNYYPEEKLPSKTTNTLITVAGILLATGLSLIEPKLFSNFGKFVNVRASFRESLFRFINRML